jgi:HK97 family phage prohead protease
LETKFLNIEVKATEEGEGVFTGYGSVFGNVDRVDDVVLETAFDDFLASGKQVPMLWQHDAGEPIGIYSEMRKDDNGLFVKGQINMKTERGRETYELLKQGAVKGLSIGFRIQDEEFRNGIRYIKRADLWEISVVTFPANPEAEVIGVKSDMTIKQFERTLREVGFSKEASKMIASKGFKAWQDEREAIEGEADKDGEQDIMKSIEDMIASKFAELNSK